MPWIMHGCATRPPAERLGVESARLWRAPHPCAAAVLMGGGARNWGIGRRQTHWDWGNPCLRQHRRTGRRPQWYPAWRSATLIPPASTVAETFWQVGSVG
ncbi:hypothetical protein CZ674_11610 [Agrococcus casei LMG 22410]|uniref:Uncharacterized protein n=1 Tax=Agrococcus casei LMG 22410 TaxID=1255656 RepID=A0A1R4GFJ7_9MICO|nr:hypothetical protein CZ674_11610 [Agrococcus casei LMG 22410]